MIWFDESELDKRPVLAADPVVPGNIRDVAFAAFEDALEHTRHCLICLGAGQLVAVQGTLCEEGEALRTTWREAEELAVIESGYRNWVMTS